MEEYFVYFAYASNLSSERLFLSVQEAERIGVAKLEDYQLNFDYFSKRWMGAAATIVPKSGSTVWGALWKIHKKYEADLEREEGVDDGLYKALEVEVFKENEDTMKAKVFQQSILPNPIESLQDLPKERRPSLNYLNIILKGGIESNLPNHYLNLLKAIPHNGYDGNFDIKLSLKCT